MERKYRKISEIAQDIIDDGYKNPSAKPYVNAMLQITNITDDYMYEDGKSIVSYFLANAQYWRGTTAKTIKAELKMQLTLTSDDFDDDDDMCYDQWQGETHGY